MSYAVVWYRGRVVIDLTPWPGSLETAANFARDQLPVKMKQDRVTTVKVIDVDDRNAVLVSLQPGDPTSWGQ